MNDTPQARHERDVRAAILLIMQGFTNFDFTATAHPWIRLSMVWWAGANLRDISHDVIYEALDRCYICLGYTDQVDPLQALAPTAP
jgi:DNA-binding PucR family transcriptional regulator